jgi:CheY-like chemotaxis protein
MRWNKRKVADTNSSNRHNNENKSILVLDDEPDIATIVKKFLQDLGFRVSAFTDPVVALEYLKSNFRDCCSLTISDIRMPGMNGYEFVKKVKEIKPECKIILMSAFEINDIELSKVLPGFRIDAFLQKPFSIRKLNGLIMEKCTY